MLDGVSFHDPLSKGDRPVKSFLQRGFAVLLLALTIQACAGGGGGGSVSGNEKGSEPVNSKEAVEYQNAVNRCYRTGGTRVVKVMGELRCY